jgi:hypothetical protein
MNLTDHVISKGNAEKLHKLGVKRESVFVWVNDYLNIQEGFQVKLAYLGIGAIHAKGKIYPAYLADEVLAMLKAKIDGYRITADAIDSEVTVWKTNRCEDDQVWYLYDLDISLANKVASCLIYLIEQGLLNVNDINNG